jgi:quinoprotein relay system zinc metallohydrolase 2
MFHALRRRRVSALPVAILLMGTLLAAPLAALGQTKPLALVETAPGVFVHLGRHEETSAVNLGDIANIGFVVGEKCVAVIDTGGSFAVGLALKAALRGKTERPICYVINTHMHPDHVFGNAAFADTPEQPRFVGNARLAAALSARAARYRGALSDALGERAASSRVVMPELLVDGRLRLDLGGRVLTLQSWPTAHTDNDLTVFDEATKTLWLGDLLFEGRIPSLDGSLKGWLAVLGKLRELPARQVIPGHGALGLPWPGALEAQTRYLEALAVRVRQALARGTPLHATVQAAEGGEAAGWQLAEAFHRRNVTAAYAELEWE